MGVGKNIVEAMRLTEYMFRNVAQCPGWAHLHALWVAVVGAEVTFKGYFQVGMNVHGTKGAGPNAGFAADASLVVEVNHAVFSIEGVYRTGRHTLGVVALTADHRHSDDRVGIDRSDPNRSFFRIVHLLPVHGAGDFADPTARTAFGDYGQLLSHEWGLQVVRSVNSTVSLYANRGVWWGAMTIFQGFSILNP
jgi:hypothetical protein